MTCNCDLEHFGNGNQSFVCGTSSYFALFDLIGQMICKG